MVKINFDFSYRRPEDLEQLNAIIFAWSVFMIVMFADVQFDDYYR